MRGLLFLALVAGAAAFAQGRPPGYEDDVAAWALEQSGHAVDPQPEGKPIAFIRIVSEKVIAARDPYPDLANAFHVETKEHVIRREVLLEVGQPYTQELADETGRNLRRLFILAVARVLPVQAPDGKVGVVIATKDRWSLRTNFDFRFVGPLLQLFVFRPSELNVAGLGHSLSLDFIYRLDALTVGELYEIPRLFGSTWTLGQAAYIQLRHGDFMPEGSRGQLVLQRPLWTLDQAWGFSSYAQWRINRRRLYRGASVWQLPFPDAERPTSTVPFIYDGRDLNSRALLTRSFGRRFKTDVAGGLAAYQRRYGAPPDSPLTGEQRAWFQANYLPRNESAVYLNARAVAYETDYRVLRNLDSFALSEDVRLGYRFLAEVRWADPAFFSRERYVELGAGARYRFYRWENLGELAVGSGVRYLPERGAWVNRRLIAQLLNHSPPFEGGRLVTRALLDVMVDDLDNRRLLLGGGNGLRGADAESLQGRNLALVNLEYRTRPVELHTVSVGFAFFYDAGSAFDRRPAFTHTMGTGLRIGLPQFNREAIRIDFGLVIAQSSRASVDRFSGSFGQVNEPRPDALDFPLDFDSPFN